jgi:hypothetical protein
MCVPFLPDKTDAPLIVDPDRMLPLAAASQSLEPVSRRHRKIVDPSRII